MVAIVATTRQRAVEAATSDTHTPTRLNVAAGKPYAKPFRQSVLAWHMNRNRSHENRHSGSNRKFCRATALIDTKAPTGVWPLACVWASARPGASGVSVPLTAWLGHVCAVRAGSRAGSYLERSILLRIRCFGRCAQVDDRHLAVLLHHLERHRGLSGSDSRRLAVGAGGKDSRTRP